MMKNVVLIALSILIVWMVWNMLRALVATMFGVALQVVLLGLFCYAVYLVYKALNRQKIM